MINSRDRFIIKEVASELCLSNSLPYGLYRVVAILTDKKGRIVSIGMNSYQKTHPIQAAFANKVKDHEGKIFLHAEIAALVKNQGKTGYGEAHTLYVNRLNRQGGLALAKPCPICSMAIREAGIKRVVYSTTSGIKEELLEA